MSILIFIDSFVKSGESYSYKLESVGYDGWIIVEQIVDVVIPIPEEFVLFNNYPNPFNPKTTLKFQLPQKNSVKLLIYDSNGRQIKKLINNTFYEIGAHTVTWDATDSYGNKVASGVYFYRFSSGNFSKLGKMVLMK